MKTQPWDLAQRIAGDFAVLEDLLQQQVRIENAIQKERSRIHKLIVKALEEFSAEHEQTATE